MKNRSDKITKGIAFAGCSFTWGQGLWYYSNLSSLVEQPLNEYHANDVHFSHRKYAHKKRFARLVADHFDTFEIARYENGGSLDAILHYWRDVAFNKESNRLIGSEQLPAYRAFDSADVEYFVLQCTSYLRTDTTIEVRSKTIGPIQLWNLLENHKEDLKNYLDDNKMTLDDFLKTCRSNDVRAYKELLIYLENLGIKTVIMTWPEQLVHDIGSDPWLNQRMIRFDYVGTTYNSIEKLIENNSGMTIDTDFQNFEIPPTDNHPSMLCHRIIAASIINKIKEIKNDRSTTDPI